MTFRPYNGPTHLYFVTATIAGWKKLFNKPHFAQIVLESLKWLCENKHIELFAFVLMPNHSHFVCRPLNPNNMSAIKQKFGSFTAHAILKELRKQNQSELLDYFRQKALEAKEATNHKIWENIQAKNIYSKEFLAQKLEYIHNNPIQPRWQLVEERSSWQYSSASFYDEDKIPIIPISDVRSYLA